MQAFKMVVMFNILEDLMEKSQQSYRVPILKLLE